MILDTSAVVAVFLQEPGYQDLVARLAERPVIGIGTPTLAECGIVLSARLQRDAAPLLERFLQEFGVEPIPFGQDHWREAVDAWLRFGKGRHPAALNFGDCCAYSTARLADLPLLCTGGDFGKTDLALA